MVGKLKSPYVFDQNVLNMTHSSFQLHPTSCSYRANGAIELLTDTESAAEIEVSSMHS
jgi:hypothetical protein